MKVKAFMNGSSCFWNLAGHIIKGTLPAYLLSNLTDAWVTIGNGVSFIIGKMTIRDKKKRMVG